MEQEMAGRLALAQQLYRQAWEKSVTDTEKFTAAHYLARVQDSVPEKLKWDQTALDLALRISSAEVKSAYPSLYLNIGKCYEDLQCKKEALEHYTLARACIMYLKNDGYGQMIRAGIEAGIERVK